MKLFKDALGYDSSKWWELIPLTARLVPLSSEVIAAMMSLRATGAKIGIVQKKTWNGSWKIKPKEILDNILGKLTDLGQNPNLITRFDAEYLEEYGEDLIIFFFASGALFCRFGREEAEETKYGSFTLISFDEGLFETLSKDIAAQVDPEPPAGTIYMMCSTPKGIEFLPVGTGGHKLERGNYTENELVLYDRIKEDLVAKNPKGRLHILAGVPGSGKTFALRGLLAETRGVGFVLTPAAEIAVLANPTSLSALTSLREDLGKMPIVLLIEDADRCLVNRADGDLSAISSILNLGDGIMGAVLDIRIVATTNAKLDNLDKAITRPGRLSTEITFEALAVEKANEVFQRLTGTPGTFTAPTILAEIYTKAYDAGWKPPVLQEKRPMGFATNPIDDVIRDLARTR